MISDIRNLQFLSVDLEPGERGDAGCRWHKIGVLGTWKGHHQGEFSLSREKLSEAARNQKSRKVDILVDYEHSSLMARFTGNGKAAGWAKSLETREGGSELWACIEWTEAAARAIDAREYRYLSPVYRWNTPDRRSGKGVGVSVPSIGLTNTPFLEELDEVQLNSLFGLTGPALDTKGEDEMESLTRIYQALSLGDGANVDAAVSAIEELRKDAAVLEPVCTELSIEPGSGTEEILAAIKAIGSNADQELSAAKEAADKYMAELRAIKAGNAISEAEKAGKIVGQNRQWAKSLAESDLAAFSAWAKSAPAVGPATGRVDRSRNQPSRSFSAEVMTDEAVVRMLSALDDDDRYACSMAGISAEQYVRMNWADLCKEKGTQD